MIISIDGGTTNTRFYLMQNGEILSFCKQSIGIRDTFQPGGKEYYQSEIRCAIKNLAENADTPVNAIICSGMIGSETGLYTCPHICTPVSLNKLADHMHKVSLPHISDIPFWFVPGIKTFDSVSVSGEQIAVEILSSMDIMRGEETELYGIIQQMHLSEDCTIVLPGSHMKTVAFSPQMGIIGFQTSITGELLRAAAEHTILQATLNHVYPSEIDFFQLQKGYELAKKCGLARALFKVRILDKSVSGLSSEQLHSFLLGILLCDDAAHLIQQGKTVWLAGSDPFRSALSYLLKLEGIPVKTVPASVSEQATAYGAYRLWMHKKQETKQGEGNVKTI